MREIKFRIQEASGNWFYFSLPKFGDTELYLYPDNKEETLGQYTGLKDKNGKDIYEGDIIKYLKITKDFSQEKLLNKEEIVKEVVFKSGAYNIPTYNEAVLIDEPVLEYETLTKCEIIGNIYENPELIETV